MATATEKQQGNADVIVGTVAAAMAAGGATVASLGPSAAGLAADAEAAKVTTALSAKAVGELTEKLVEQFRTFLRDRAATASSDVRAMLGRSYPERAPAVLDALANEELKRERQFQRKMEQRLRRDVPEALKIEDPEARRARLAALLAREQRYVEAREAAMHDRALARAELLAVKEASPKGAYWQLSPLVRNHTPDCIALAGQFWPWQVIEAVGPPPRHHGCRCSLLTLDEAVERDFMYHDQADVDVRDALGRARRRLADAEKLNEALDEGDWEAWLAELAEAHDPAYLKETERIKERAETPEAKARHPFKAAEWTHPNGHPRCRLCGDESRIGGICKGEPTRAEAQAWADAENKDGMWGESKWQVDARGKLTLDLNEELTESRWQLRYHAGFEHGGQFMPKLGGDPGRHLLDKAKRQLLQDFSEGAPSSGVQSRQAHRGRNVGIAGKRVFVPEHRTFDRVIRGSRYTSPPFSTEVYKDGKPYQGHRVDAATPVMKKPAAPALEIAEPKLDTARVDHVMRLKRGKDGEVMDRVMTSLAAKEKTQPPVIVGAPGEASDRALFEHGFIETHRSGGRDFQYRAPDGVSELRVRYGVDGKVAKVEWDPKEPVPVGRPATSPPRTMTDFTEDAKTLGRRLAARYGLSAIEGAWRTATEDEVRADEDMGDHGAEVRADGTTVLGADYAPSILAAAVTRAKGDPLTDEQARGVWAAYQGAAHEAHHQAVPLDQRVLQHGSDYALNEALTEELSNAEAAAWLAQTGQDDVLAWRANHPNVGKALGTYLPERQALDGLLNEAKVAPELRADFMRELMFRTRPHERFRVLAEAVAAGRGKGATARGVEGELRTAMLKDDWTRFAPMVLPDVEPTRGAGSPFTVGGKQVRVGLTVGYSWRTLTDGEWKTERAEGVVESLDMRDGGRWTADVRRGDTVDYAVPAGQIGKVEDEGKTAAVYGAQAHELELPQGTVRPGGLIRYDGRADGGYSTARVVRINRAENPHAAAEPGWVIEAVTTEDSLAPGTRVVLTADRVGGEAAPAGRSGKQTETGGLADPTHSAPRLEDVAKLRPFFDLPRGTFVIEASRLTPGPLEPPVSVEKARRVFSDPAGAGEKLPPLAVHPTRDGRFVVVDGTGALQAALDKGMTRLPAVLNAVSEVDTHLRAAERGHATAPNDATAGTLDGLKRAREILTRGGKAEDIARDALHRPGARDAAGTGSGEDGFQTGMRSAYHAVTSSPRAAAMAEYTSKKPGHGGWGYGKKPDAAGQGGSSWLDKAMDAAGYREAPKGGSGRGKPRWDDSETVRLTEKAGGSNGAMFGVDREGRKWLVKSYRGDADRIASELLANAVYRKLGIAVPEAGTLTFEGKPALAYPLVDGVPGGYKTGLRVERPSVALAQGFMADALLGNWDVVGLEHDNLLWPEGTTPESLDEHTVATRLDHGGTFQFRAMGGKKSFGPVPTEVWTMASANGGQAFGTMALTDEVKRAGAATIAKELDPATVDALVAAAPFKSEKMRGEVAEALKARVAWMADYAEGRVHEPKAAEGKAALAVLKGGQSKVALFPEQETALEAWANGWDADVNDHLRTGAAKDAAAKEVRFLVRELDSLTRHVRTPDDVTLYANLSGRVRPDDGWASMVGRSFEEPGFLGLASSRHVADKEGDATVRLLVPKGSKALYLKGLPGVTTKFAAQPEVVVGRRSRLHVVRVVVENGRHVIDAILLP